MGLFSSINIASSGLSAQRLRSEVISNNLANATTTRTPSGGPFKRSRVVFSTRNEQPIWKSPLLPNDFKNQMMGVKVSKIEEDKSAPRLIFDPTHPDSIKTGRFEGYVEMPNVDVVTEMTDMISAYRAYEANVTVIEGSKEMFMKALEISR